ncbi:hypothetical protein T484DRAFT_1813579, partial [Baffinella frigidus]
GLATTPGQRPASEMPGSRDRRAGETPGSGKEKSVEELRRDVAKWKQTADTERRCRKGMEESLRELREAQARYEKTASEAKASQAALSSQLRAISSEKGALSSRLRAISSEKVEIERAHAAATEEIEALKARLTVSYQAVNPTKTPSSARLTVSYQAVTPPTKAPSGFTHEIRARASMSRSGNSDTAKWLEEGSPGGAEEEWKTVQMALQEASDACAQATGLFEKQGRERAEERLRAETKLREQAEGGRDGE